jgi:hypothetical protein
MSGDGMPFPESSEPWRAHEPQEPWPESAVSSITLPDGGRVPTYYCVKCEAPAAVEGRPQTAELIAQYGKDATLHICFTCGYVREIALPADLKETA